MIPRIHLIALTMLLVAAVPESGFSQQAQTPTGVPSAASSSPQLRYDEPYEIPSLGLLVYLPEDSLVDLSQLQGGRTSVKILPQGKRQTWVMQIWNSISADHSLTLDHAMETIIEQKQSAKTRRVAGSAPKSLIRVFDRSDDLLIGKNPARRAYFDVPSERDGYVTGYTMFQSGPGQFVVFELDCAQDTFTTVRETYELMVASAQFRDASELSEKRAAALLAGKAFLEQFNNKDLTAALDDTPTYFRIFQPATSGAPSDAKEIAYQRITMKRGKAGDVAGKSASSRKSADNVEGFLVTIEARTLSEGAIADSVAVFFLSDNRQTELWSNRMNVKRGRTSEGWTETGFRFGDRLTVKTVQQGLEPTEMRWDDLPESYISRVETYLLPRLAVRAQLEGEFGFYAYDSFLGKLSLRQESIKQQAPDVWTITTTPTENTPASGTLLDAQGRIIRRDLPGGQVSEAIDLKKLRDLWRHKHLPLK